MPMSTYVPRTPVTHCCEADNQVDGISVHKVAAPYLHGLANGKVERIGHHGRVDATFQQLQRLFEQRAAQHHHAGRAISSHNVLCVHGVEVHTSYCHGIMALPSWHAFSAENSKFS